MWVVIATWRYTPSDTPTVYGPFDSEDDASAWVKLKQPQTTKTLTARPMERT